MQNIVFKFEGGWDFTLAMLLGPIGMVIYIFFPHLLSIWRESKTKGVAPALRAGLKKLVWFGFWVILIVSAFWTFRVGINRNFVGVTVGSQLVLNYPWPKSNVVIAWPEVVKVSSESKRFGQLATIRFRLKVVTANHTYTGLWLPTSEEVTRVGEAITSMLTQRKPHE